MKKRTSCLILLSNYSHRILSHYFLSAGMRKKPTPYTQNMPHTILIYAKNLPCFACLRSSSYMNVLPGLACASLSHAVYGQCHHRAWSVHAIHLSEESRMNNSTRGNRGKSERRRSRRGREKNRYDACV